MSKAVKQMELATLKKTFEGVRDLVMMSVTGLTSQMDNQIRLGLRKKGIRLQVVKNSVARRVFDEMGLKVAKGWEGPTTVAWGASSIAELSKEIESLAKKNEKNFKVKTAVADGSEISFAAALKMPTRPEVISQILGMILSPAAQIAAQVGGPAGQIAGQLKTLSEKKPEGEAAPA